MVESIVLNESITLLKREITAIPEIQERAIVSYIMEEEDSDTEDVMDEVINQQNTK